MSIQHWIVLHWFELSTLALLIFNLWFVYTVLAVLRQTNRWLNFLSLRWDQLAATDNPRIDDDRLT